MSPLNWIFFPIFMMVLSVVIVSMVNFLISVKFNVYEWNIDDGNLCEWYW